MEIVKITPEFIQKVQKYSDLGPFSEGMAVVTKKFKSDTENESYEKYGFIDVNGDEVIPCQYDWAIPFFNGVAIVERNEMYGFVDKTGKEVIPIIYDEVGDFSCGVAVVKYKGKRGYTDLERNTTFID